jgi:hypothetical protein
MKIFSYLVAILMQPVHFASSLNLWCTFAVICWMLTCKFSYPSRAGISIIESNEEGIVMELEMNWDANPSIILDVKTRLGVALPIQVIYFMSMFLVLFYEFCNIRKELY